MKKLFAFSWLLVSFFILAGGLWADEIEAAAAQIATNTGVNIKEEVNKEYVTGADLDALKDLLDEQIRKSVAAKGLINFSGTGTLGFYNYQTENKQDYFGLSGAGLTLSGNLREDPVKDGDLKYRVSFRYSGVSPSASVLTDVFLNWNLLSGKVDLEPAFTLNLTLGQFLVPFGSDNLATEDKIPTVNKAQYLSSLGISRDLGLYADGGIINGFDSASNITTPLVSYTLGVINGSRSNKVDDNERKDFIGRIIIAPVKEYFSVFRGLKFGGSYYSGHAGAQNTKKERIGAEFEWLKKPILITAEYVEGKDGAIAKGASVETITKSQGIVGTLFWTTEALPEFQPLFRFDRFDPDKDKINNRKDIYTLGFNYFFYQVAPYTRRVYETTKSERVIKLQVNYNRIKEERAQIPNDELTTQIVFNF